MGGELQGKEPPLSPISGATNQYCNKTTTHKSIITHLDGHIVDMDVKLLQCDNISMQYRINSFDTVVSPC